MVPTDYGLRAQDAIVLLDPDLVTKICVNITNHLIAGKWSFAGLGLTFIDETPLRAAPRRLTSSERESLCRPQETLQGEDQHQSQDDVSTGDLSPLNIQSRSDKLEYAPRNSWSFLGSSPEHLSVPRVVWIQSCNSSIRREISDLTQWQTKHPRYRSLVEERKLKIRFSACQRSLKSRPQLFTVRVGTSAW